ncbi:MAG: S-methyl-5'-thioadenosine phosphorylase [Chloroflexi bacterium]|nr:S-methyl-5'-thioadenosine phosphorylase [Chloroflexota bacterium]
MTDAEYPLGIIGGSGLYTMAGLENTAEHHLDTPFGAPSAPVLTGTLEGVPVAFLARHGRGHVINPTNVNYRANIYTLKTLGVRWLVSVSACGSLREDYAPGHIVVPDQLFDHTRDRKRSFFDGGLVAHVGVADPFCSHLADTLFECIRSAGAVAHRGGTFITIEGPRFSTRGESNVFRAWGMSLIGMTTSPEAFLAREAEMCYAVMAHVTDYDVWHITEEEVSVEQVVRILNQNTAVAQAAIRALAAQLDLTRACEHQNALRTALITDRAAVSAEALDKLGVLVSRYYPRQ